MKTSASILLLFFLSILIYSCSHLCDDDEDRSRDKNETFLQKTDTLSVKVD